MGRGFDSQNLFWTIIAIIAGFVWLVQSEYAYILIIALSLYLLYKFAMLVGPDEPKISSEHKTDVYLKPIKPIKPKIKTQKKAHNPLYEKSEIFFTNSNDVDRFLSYQGYIYGSEIVIKNYNIDKNRIDGIIKKHHPIIFKFIDCELTPIKPFSKITRFTSFEFIDCNLESINSDIRELLKNINVFGLSIEQFQPVKNLDILIKYKHLTSITLKLGMEKFPNFILEMKQLESLDLSDNYFKKIPVEIKYLKRLETLHLANNSITEIPKEIAQIRKLQVLNIEGNQIQTLPKEITNLKLNWLFINHEDLSGPDKKYFQEYFEGLKYFAY